MLTIHELGKINLSNDLKFVHCKMSRLNEEEEA
jgi:hypothetical protein